MTAAWITSLPDSASVSCPRSPPIVKGASSKRPALWLAGRFGMAEGWFKGYLPIPITDDTLIHAPCITVTEQENKFYSGKTRTRRIEFDTAPSLAGCARDHGWVQHIPAA